MPSKYEYLRACDDDKNEDRYDSDEEGTPTVRDENRDNYQNEDYAKPKARCGACWKTVQITWLDKNGKRRLRGPAPITAGSYIVYAEDMN